MSQAMDGLGQVRSVAGVPAATDGRIDEVVPPLTAPGSGEAAPEPTSDRRRLLKRLIGIATGAFAVAFVLPALAIRSLTLITRDIAAGDVLVYAPTSSGFTAGDPLALAQLAEGEGAQVFPRDKADNANNLVQIVRIGPGGGADALAAYSAICTHLGCAVYPTLNAEGLIACPCHGSLFDPRQGAAVVGGPAPRPLPSLPVSVDATGTVVVAGPFSGPIGPQ